MHSLRIRPSAAEKFTGQSTENDASAQLERLKDKYRTERDKVTLFRSPLLTLRLFCAYVAGQVAKAGVYFAENKGIGRAAGLVGCCVLSFVALSFVPGPHRMIVDVVVFYLSFMWYWVGLGIMSSVMVGTGLHTFVLFLGPHIAKVTLAATECRTVDLLEVSYDVFQCPSNTTVILSDVSVWDIFWRIQMESFLWGLGTAIGELPPYFVARAARLAGGETEEELELESVGKDAPFMMRMKAYFYKNIKDFGFVGIMLFASIPNPLFDLAGIACGHFLVPFKVFFGATMVGKAFIKAHIQAFFVIIIFNKSTLERLTSFIGSISPSSTQLVQDFLKKQMDLYHGGASEAAPDEKSIVGKSWDVLLTLMLLYFVVSIINSTAQSVLSDDTADVEKNGEKKRNV